MKDYHDHRDFYLLVREFLKIHQFTDGIEFQRYLKVKKEIEFKLSDFTKSEQESLPFKD